MDEITRSGVPCYFSVGRDVPLEKGKPEMIFEGNSLNVTPTANADGNIGMQIELSVRTRLRNDLKSASMPSFRTVEVNTNVSIPSGSTLVLGDGDFDGTALQAAIRAATWDYACRTASNITIYAADRVFTVGDLPVQRGEAVAIADVEMTGARYGPILLIGVWEEVHDEPIYLITSLTDAQCAIESYRLRFRIECMFAEHKSRGFHIHKSHLKKPERVARLLIATSLAYLWVHAVAMFAQAQGWIERFHRKDR